MTLKTGSDDNIRHMFLVLQDEARILLRSLIEMTYFMRGSISYESMLLTMSYAERQLIASFIKERLEQEAKTPYPVY